MPMIIILLLSYELRALRYGYVYDGDQSEVIVDMVN